ncbi:MAG TPA: cysteine desulfurase family protein [Roseiarcus sp.]|nr:cysteine desulfurase family protein [Roseiarcus sp.]
MPADRPTTRTYLDHNATSPLRPEARAAALAAMDAGGNPSSIHAEGRAARLIVENARAEIRGLCGAAARSVTFVSSGTEAANTALNIRFGIGPREAALDRLIVGAGEHPCVLRGGRFPESAVEVAPLRGDGRVDLDWVEAACRKPGRVLLALQGANNETGIIQPVAEAAALVHASDGRVFCDAVQLAGRTACDVSALGADAIAVSAHKMGGPKGAGAIVAASLAFSLGEPLIRGGGQERGARAGTENVAAIAGFGAAARACRLSAVDEEARLLRLRDRLAEGVRAAAPDAVVFGETSPRLPNTLCFAVPSIEAATLMIALDLAGVATSSGSACSSGKVTPSHVLRAMGVRPELARGAIRLSLGWTSSESDVECFDDAFRTALRRMRRGRTSAAL